MTMLNQQHFSIPAQQAQIIKEHLMAMQNSAAGFSGHVTTQQPLLQKLARPASG